MPTFEIDDFTAGFSDLYLEGNAAKKVDNFVIDENRELVQRGGLAQFSNVVSQPAGNQRIDALYVTDGFLFVKSGKSLYRWQLGTSSSWNSSTDLFSDSEINSGLSISTWRGHLFMTPCPTSNKRSGCYTRVAYPAGSGTWFTNQAGCPSIDDATAGSGSLSVPSISSAQPIYHYTWYAAFRKGYTAVIDGNEVLFRHWGKPKLIHEDHANAISGSKSYTFQGFGYTNKTGENYNTTGLVVDTFRTKGNQTTPLKAVTDSLGAAIVDNVTDANLGDPMYIGDIVSPALDNDPVPKAFFSEIVDDRMGYFGTEDTDSDEFEYDTYRESKPGQPEAVPAGNYVRVEGKATGLAHVGVYPLLFTADKVYRVEGHYDLFGGGGLRARVISETEGCVSHTGIIRQKDFVLFPSRNGFCWTDGFKVINLTETHLHKSYAALLNKQNIVGAFHEKERRAYWAVESASNSPSGVNNQLWVFDARWSTPDRAVFTTASMPNDNMQITALHYAREYDALLFGDKRGYVYTLDADATTDKVIEHGTDVDAQSEQSIIPHYISPAIRGPVAKASVWVSHFFAQFGNTTGDLSVGFEGYDDDKPTPYYLRTMRQRGVSGVHRFKGWWRRGHLRSLYKQIGLRKEYVVLLRSADVGTASASGSTMTLTTDPAGGHWPTYNGHSLIGYFIHFDEDPDDTPFEITGVFQQYLTVDGDPSGLGMHWTIRGYPKDERMHLMKLSIPYEIPGEAYRGHREGDDGQNP